MLVSKKEFIEQYGYQNYNDIKNLIISDLTMLKYQKKIKSYKIINKTDCYIIYLTKDKFININIVELYNLFNKKDYDCMQYLYNNSKERK